MSRDLSIVGLVQGASGAWKWSMMLWYLSFFSSCLLLGCGFSQDGVGEPLLPVTLDGFVELRPEFRLSWKSAVQAWLGVCLLELFRAKIEVQNSAHLVTAQTAFLQRLLQRLLRAFTWLNHNRNEAWGI